jgi:predicted nucleic acid-binding Zn ribbon protein
MDMTSLEREQADRAQPAGDFLRSVLKRVGLDERRTTIQIQRIWSQSLDPNLVAHARPAGLHKGTLFVNVDSSVWLSEIVRYHRREILTRLQHALGSNLIQRVSFRLG